MPRDVFIDEDPADRIRNDLYARYPTVNDAVNAVIRGEYVECWGNVSDGDPMRHSVLDTDEGPVVEQAVFLGYALANAVRCARLQSDDLPSTDAGILSALNELHDIIRPVLEAEVRDGHPGYQAEKLTAFTETINGIAFFGWRVHYPISTIKTWEDTWDTATWNQSMAFSDGVYEDSVPETEPKAIHTRMQRHGVPLLLCEGCDSVLTNRHPRWPGVWVTPVPENTACCETPAGHHQIEHPGLPGLPSPDDDFGFPHQPRPQLQLLTS